MYDNKQIIKALFYLKSGEILSVNESYNTQHLGFSTKCCLAVQKAVTSLYGMRCNWPAAIDFKELRKEMESQ